MKFSPLVFATAVGIFLFTAAVSKRTVPVDIHVPIDFTGIEVLNVQSGGSINVGIQKAGQFEMSYANAKGHGAKVERQGNVMSITGNLDSYQGLALLMPDTVHVINMDGGTITAKEKIGHMQVNSSGYLSWNGDVGNLKIHERKPGRNCESGCPNNINIADGTIGELYISSLDARVTLSKAELLGNTTLALGPKSPFEINRVENIGKIKFVEYSNGR